MLLSVKMGEPIINSFHHRTAKQLSFLTPNVLAKLQ